LTAETQRGIARMACRPNWANVWPTECRKAIPAQSTQLARHSFSRCGRDVRGQFTLISQRLFRSR